MLGKLDDEHFANSDKDSDVEVEIESKQESVHSPEKVNLPEPSSLVIELENDKDFPEINLPDYKDIHKVDSLNQPQSSLITNEGDQLPKVEAPEERVSKDEENQINFIDMMHRVRLSDETRQGLIQLMNMGFYDFQKVLAALKKNDNDVEKATIELCASNFN